jgi:ATP-dependent DNA helicase RecQ
MSVASCVSQCERYPACGTTSAPPPFGHAVTADPEKILRDVFGFDSFRPGQREIVDKLLSGRHVLAVMPTGAGKSLCYQVPALLQDGLTVVISPLVALIDDQVAALQANGVAAARIHSGRSREDNVADWRRVESGAAPMLYMSPERLMTPRMLSALQRIAPALFVVDEAHCVSKWGTNFRPEYGALADLQKHFPNATKAGFTATADTATQRDVAAKLFAGQGDVIVHGFDRPNLWLGVTPKTKWRDQLRQFLRSRGGQSGIVYCLSRRLTEEVATMLHDDGVHALPYHAGLSPEVRTANQETFMAEDGVVMVATIAFGMGIDKPDIRFVFHTNLPGSMESYYQEVGRAGRDGAASEVFMIYGLDDVRMRRQFIVQDGDDTDHQRREHKRLDALLAYCEASQCRRVTLLTYFGETTEPCGNCDVCQDPPKMVDGTTEAQMLFSAVHRTGERFGTVHIMDVLLGKANERITTLGHNNLPTFGAGAERTKTFWQAFIRQAVAGGYLQIDIERFGGLRLSDRGRLVLKGDETFEYREAAGFTLTAKARKQKASVADLDGIDADLYAALKAVRRDIAQTRNVPAYVIFADKTLQHMCLLQPKSLDDMAKVNGVGPTKLKEFGVIFLEALADGVAAPADPDGA